jgi:hypothetical protein
LTVLVLACSSQRGNEAMVTPSRVVATEEGTLAVSVITSDVNCNQEQRCAAVEAVRTLLFVGVPGSAVRRALVTDETSARQKHAAFFRQLLEQGGHARYITGVTRSSGRADQTGEWTVVVNYEALRTALEKEGIIRKFGF